ncbi:hypothetical protein D3C86_1789210 [compost metagenome]
MHNTSPSPATISNRMNFMGIRPMKNIKQQVAPKSKAVDRFAGAISPQIISTGNSTGKKPFQKLPITFCFRLSWRARKVKMASLAKSEV